MIDWIKRAWQGFADRFWFGPNAMKIGGFVVVRNAGSPLPSKAHAEKVLADITAAWQALPIEKRAAYVAAQREATIAQKNLRLASIARTRGKLKDEIQKAVDHGKKRSHLRAELERLTRLELELVGEK